MNRGCLQILSQLQYVVSETEHIDNPRENFAKVLNEERILVVAHSLLQSKILTKWVFYKQGTHHKNENGRFDFNDYVTYLMLAAAYFIFNSYVTPFAECCQRQENINYTVSNKSL